MASESRLPLVIFLALVAIIAIPFVFATIRDRLRPVMVEARVVTATSSDPVYRNGRRTVEPGADVEIALALRLERWGRSDIWLSPAGELEIDGSPVAHQESSLWPDDDRLLRVFWFSVECPNLGGALTAETAAERLGYRTFLAPEMGQALRAERLPEPHNDDYLGETDVQSANGSGTYRTYARVEVVEAADDIRALQTATTLDADHVLDPAFSTILVEADLGERIAPSAGELFRLPGFEPQGTTAAAKNDVTRAAFDKTFAELVSDRIVVSSWTLAASAVSGQPDLEPARLESLGRVAVDDSSVAIGGRPLKWDEDVLSGDLLADGDHWFVLLGDNGDGVLDPSDAVLHSWGRPPARTTLYAAVEADTALLEHRRLTR